MKRVVYRRHQDMHSLLTAFNLDCRTVFQRFCTIFIIQSYDDLVVERLCETCFITLHIPVLQT